MICTRSVLLAVLVALALTAFAAPATAGELRRVACANVVFTPRSGGGLFEIRVRNISCAAARRKLRAARGDPDRLRAFRCRLVRRLDSGAGRYACRSRARVRGALRTRLIAYTTGS